MGKLLRVSFLACIAGIILRISDYISAFFIVHGSSDVSIDMSNRVMLIHNIISVVLIVLIGVIVRKTLSRMECFKSTSILVGYSILLFVFERIILATGAYGGAGALYTYFYIPADIFGVLTSLLLKFIPASELDLLLTVPSFFSPYLLLLFCKGKNFKDDV